MKILKSLACILLVLSLILPSQAAFAEDDFDYVALGDSLAFGFNENSLPGKGYVDFFAELLANDVELTSYNKGFSFPGYTTVNVLADLENNVERYSNGEPDKVNMNITDAVAEAEIITLSVGANDVLRTLDQDAEGKLIYEVAEVAAAIQQTAANVGQILAHLYEINETAEIYVMGFYNPFPALTDQASAINFLVTQMDTTIQQAVTNHGAYFVSVKEQMASDTASYLPNPQNIHPSEVGYNMIAEQFYAAWQAVKEEPPVEEPQPTITFNDVPATHWAYENVKEATGRGMIKGYPDGSFKPDATLEKVHFTSILTRALQLTATKPVAFLDVADYDAATQAEIAAAHEALIVRNFTGYFNPRQPLTRIEAARMFYAANTHLTGQPYVPTSLVTFSDTVALSKEDQAAIAMLKQYGVTNGYPDGTFKADAQITRAEAIAMVLRFLQ